MPHDKNGQQVNVGDGVLIRATVTGVSPGEEFCNVNLETVEPMFPGEHKTPIVLNARQVEKYYANEVTIEFSDDERVLCERVRDELGL